ncbi:E3 SUMO-protein ligase RanBP2 [Bombina bombina]|uniref:E3 SUMO-protein ligase RanBP2 n=1 Tax=Bombina bombina TaxID=8345 RepID=UPI00235B116F|nr:E3 SUMO-protein ligase RanBP2 [Bombina bombina]
MRRSKAEIHKYIESAQNSAASPREKSMKGFLFAKLYYEAKEYDLAKRCVSSYINVQERDPKAHKFLGHLFEIEGNVEKAVGCYKRSVELNPTQKELILKIAELLCTLNVTDGKAKYWVERASKLFPGSPAVFRLKEKLLNPQDDEGWNQLFDLIQSELFARPDDVFVNIRLVELYKHGKRLEEAVSHCLKPERRVLRSNLEWCTCVVKILKEFLSNHQGSGSDKSKWRTLNKELLLALADVVLLTLSSRDVQDSKEALQSFDQALFSLKRHVSGTDTDDLSVTFVEMRGHYYMHAGTLLLKMAQHNEAQWKALIEPAILCYCLAFKVPRPKIKPIKGEDNGQDIIEGLALDRQSQSAHLLLTLSYGKQDFISEVIETFANINGQAILQNFLFEGHLSMEKSFMGSDDINDIVRDPPDINYEAKDSTELCRYDYGAIRLHCGSLQHLTWLGLQWHFMDSFPAIRKWLKQLFPRLPQETSRIDSNSPESICMLDLEVFLLAVVYTSHLQLQNNFNTSNEQHRPRCLPLPICKQLCTDRQLSWWDAVYNLVNKKALPGTSAKLRLVIQHGLGTLRSLEKHGLQPALLIHWARSLYKTGNSLNSFYDQREYIGRCVHYWRRVLPLLDIVKQRRSIPEPVDPLFSHFHSIDVKVSDVKGLEDEAQIAFATLDLVDGKIDDAIVIFYDIKNVLSYWNLALAQELYAGIRNLLEEYGRKLCERLDAITVKVQTARVSSNTTAMEQDSPLEPQCDAAPKDPQPRSPALVFESAGPKLEPSFFSAAATGVRISEITQHNSLFIGAGFGERYRAHTMSRSLLPDLNPANFSQQVVSTSGPAAYYGQSPAYNSQHLLRPAASITPTKTSMYAMNRLPPQQHMYAYPQQMHTPPTQNTAPCVFPQEIYAPPLRFESPATGILSPHNEEYFNYSVPPTTNPQLPEPGYFTKPSMGPQQSKSEGSKVIEFGKSTLGQSLPTEGTKGSSFMLPLQSTPASSTFKFNSNFKSNDGDFTFSSHGVAQPSTYTCSESLLGLLTSDKPAQDHGKKSASFENPVDQSNLFRFGDKGISNNFNNKSQDKNSAMFGQGFQNTGKSTLLPTAFVTQSKETKDVQNQSVESDGGSEHAADDDGPHFEPIIPLPEKVEVKTGEEDEEEMFCNRAKLFRFDADSKEWKERGIGNVKILRHRISGKIRLLMRREQVLKICANHYINADMKLKPIFGSDKSYVWHAFDYADEMPKPEQLAIRFKTVDEATLFKARFEEAQKLLGIVESSTASSKQGTEKETTRLVSKESGKTNRAAQNFGSPFFIKEGEWRCDVCLVKNTGNAEMCLSCQNPNPSKSNNKEKNTVKDIKANTPASTMSKSASILTFSKDTTSSKTVFGESSMKSKEQWECTKCSKKNDTASKNCVSCQNTILTQALSDDSFPATNTTCFKNVSTVDGTFGSAFVKKSGQWDCNVCLVRNESSAVKCVACQTPNESNAQTVTQTASSFKFVSPESGSQKDFGSIFVKKGQQDSYTSSQVTPVATAPTFQIASKFKFGTNADINNKQTQSLETLFARKEGQWDCKTCCVRNEASALKCVSCHSPNMQVTANATVPSVQSSSGLKFGTTADPNNKQSKTLEAFSRKEGQWDCNTCCVRNEASALKCVSCLSPNTQVTANATAHSVQSASGLKFGTTADLSNKQSKTLEAFSRKEGQWDCNTCCVRNEASALKCVSCLSPNTQVTANATAHSVQSASGLKFGTTADLSNKQSKTLEAFSRKEGQWDCNTCCVRNEASALKCVSCLSPNTQVTANATAPSAQSASGLKFGTTADLSNKQSKTFEAFSRKDGQWDCNVCLVRNESSAMTCAACQTPNPNGITSTTASQTKSAFTFGLKSNTSEPFGQPSTTFKCDFSAKDFKFGTTEEKANFSFKAPATNIEAKPAKEGFSFSMPANATSFKFGIQEPNKSENKTKETLPAMLNVLVQKSEDATVIDCSSKAVENEQKLSSDLVFGQSTNIFSFSDLAQTSASDSFAFSKTDPNFKGFTRAGEKLFSTQNEKPTEANTSANQENTEDFYKTEERDDIHFEPIVQLPDKFELVTGEEDEKVLYSERVKLFRFDAEISQWKERGVGILKILKNEVNGRLRMLMRREQVLKVCANHWITTTMNLKPLSGSDRAWMWMASDFSDGDAKLEQLAAKFKTPEQAETFKNKFEECQRLLLDIPLQTPHKLVDTGRTAHLIQKAEEMKCGLKDLKTFLTDKVKTLDEGDTNVSSSEMVKKTNAEHTEATYEWDTYDMRGDALEGNLDDSVYASPITSSPEKKNLFRFGESTTGFSFSFEPVLSPSKSPAKLNHSRVSVGTDEESDVTQEDERDGQYFEPVVPLPDLIEVTSGEENEQTLFCHRAKLYRFDKDNNQWKERGIGDLKILQNLDTKAARVVMRRDQVLKLCANHRITPNLNLQPMKGAERSWVWTAQDYSEAEGKVECFAVRFKLQEVADSFRELFEEAKDAQAKDLLLTPVSSRGTTPRASPCGKAAIAILEETTRDKTNKSPEVDISTVSQAESDVSSSSEKSSKTLVSPPKFVFGSDVVKNIFSSEKPKPFTFGSTSSSGTLFGFNFSSSKNQSSEESKPPPKLKLDFTSTSNATGASSVVQTPQSSTISSSVTESSIITQAVQPRGFNFNLFKSNPAAFWTCTSRLNHDVEVKGSDIAETDSSSEVIFMYELVPTTEQRALAEKLLLPPTFFCYKNKPGYVSDESDIDDEDFEIAVKKLNGQLYPETVGSSRKSIREAEKECVIIWEKTPTPKEKAKADILKLPPTFFCGLSSDTEEDKETQEDFESEVRKVKEAEESKKTEVSSSSDITAVSAVITSSISPPKLEEPDSTTDSALGPVEVSPKTENVMPDSTSQGFTNISFSFGIDSGSGLSFAELASKNSGDFAFGSKDTNFQWANTGAAVFSAPSQNQKENEDNDEEEVHNDEVHFEPIVSLPEVEVKSGEEDEEILFKERTKLYRWDRDSNQWKERGVGEIKILFHCEKKYYRVLMRREQVFKVCANHVISKTIKLNPLSTSSNALVWIATDYSDGEGRVEQFAARFKTQELADSFQMKFEECQQNLPDLPAES